MKIEVSIGEIIDKFTILELKLKYIVDEDKLKNIRNEYEILKHVVNHDIKLDLSNPVYLDLLHVNESLWRIEDEIRLCEKNNDFGTRFVDLAGSVYITNDKRASLKKQLNNDFGSTITEEKSYSDY